MKKNEEVRQKLFELYRICRKILINKTMYEDLIGVKRKNKILKVLDLVEV